jgi:hypothetical protein
MAPITTTEFPGLSVKVSDPSGQKVAAVSDVDPGKTVGEFVSQLVAEMSLPLNVPFTARLEREGRHLRASEIVGDALENNDSIELHPDVSAG